MTRAKGTFPPTVPPFYPNGPRPCRRRAMRRGTKADLLARMLALTPRRWCPLVLAILACARAAPSAAQADTALVLRGADSAVATTRNDAQRAVRLVLLARALDRLSMLEESARSYLRAAKLLPSVGDWLALRAAGATADRAQRAALYRTVRGDVARDRVAITEAQALSRERAFADAAAIYDSLRLPARALKMRVQDARTDSLKLARLRQQALALA